MKKILLGTILLVLSQYNAMASSSITIQTQKPHKIVEAIQPDKH